MQQSAPNRLRKLVWGAAEDDPDPPISAELFSVERLAEHARSLVPHHAVQPDRTARHPVAARAQENGRVLLDCYEAIAETRTAAAS